MLRRLFSIALFTLVIAVLAGCGGGNDSSSPATTPAQSQPSTPPPSAGEVISKSLAALKPYADGSKKFGVHYSFAARLELTLGAGANAQMKQLLGQPITLSASGDISGEAFTLDGSLQNLFGKNKYPFSARGDRSRSFIKMFGQWYGPGQSLYSASKKKTSFDAEKFDQALPKVRELADQILNAQVAAGSSAGEPTWDLSGSLDAKTIEQLAGSNKPLSADNKAALEQVANDLQLTYSVGREDFLPRQISISFAGDVARYAALAQDKNAAEQAKQIKSFSLQLALGLTEWGKQVRISAPASPRPTSELTQKLAAELLAPIMGISAGGGSTDSSSPPSSLRPIS